MSRVCVIGAGVSGLAAVKELREVGVEVDCFEMMPIVSGVFGSHTWKDGRLTSSTVSTWYSDFPVENRQHFMTWREFVDYLESYVDHFGLRSSIQLRSRSKNTCLFSSYLLFPGVCSARSWASGPTPSHQTPPGNRIYVGSIGIYFPNGF